MIQTYRCIRKIRDNHNNVKQFVLMDIQSSRQFAVDKDELKTKMSLKQVKITNLQIDSQGRLVDKQEEQSQEQMKSNNVSKQLSDMSNRELKEYIDRLSETDKISNERLFRVLREIANRCSQLDNNINGLSEDMQQLRLNTLEQNSADPVSQVQTIQNFLLDNQSELGQIKTDIQNLSSQIANLNIQSATETPVREIPTATRNIISSTGKFNIPEDEYSKYYYDLYFTPEITTDDIQTQLNAYDTAFSSLSITPDIVSRLQHQIAVTSEAYYKTEEFYNAQYSDYASNICGSQVLALATDTISGKFKNTAKVSPNVAKKIGKELSNNLLKLVPFKEADANYNQTLEDFKNRSDLSKEQANKLMTEMNGIWNCAVEFISNNPEWEVMLYVIQTMNHMHLKTYKIGENFNHNTVVNDRGTMKSYRDSSLTDKYSNKLTEYSLKSCFETLEKRSAIQDKQYECLKKVYDRFVISYFSAKKLMYENDYYPFSDRTTKETNGAVVALTEIGLYLSNVSRQAALSNIEAFIMYNNNKNLQQYAITIPADLSQYFN